MAVPVRRRDTALQPIQRWDPLRGLEGLQEHLAQLIQRTSDGDGGAPFIPLVDIEETEDAWTVEADLRARSPRTSTSRSAAPSSRSPARSRSASARGSFAGGPARPASSTPHHAAGRCRRRAHRGGAARRGLDGADPKPEQERPRRIDVRSG